MIQWWTFLNISDSALNITGKQQTGKDHEKSQNKWLFFQYWCWRDEKLKISELLMGYFEKFKKGDFSEICIFFWFHCRRLLTRTKKVKNTRLRPAMRKITLQELISLFLVFFWRICKVSPPAMFMAGSEELSYVQRWISIVQNSSESIRWSRITCQVLFSNHILGGGRNYV